jgi:hypothetical protein|tara:strand:- start:245 stop:559 length:315 start_codon:yes stop_codon:yes gene_type:complete
MKVSAFIAMWSLFWSTTCYHLVKAYPSRPPNEFFYTKIKTKDPTEVLNMRQILKMQPAWDPKIPDNKRTKKNATWTSIKLTDGSVLTLKEKMDDVLNRMRNAQQ